MNRLFMALLLPALIVCALLYYFAQVDLWVAGQFYDGASFPWRAAELPNFFHNIVHPLSLSLAAVFAALTLWHAVRKSGWRRWAFMLLTLIIGPGLIANTLLKDNWGRARPVQVEQFGGAAQFTPPFVIAGQCDKNCSFVAGDPSFGFWTQALAYIVPRRRRQVFWAGVSVGAFYGVLRIGMGAHFFSDVLIGGLLMLMSNAAICALLFGRRYVDICWREWLGLAPRRVVKT